MTKYTITFNTEKDTSLKDEYNININPKQITKFGKIIIENGIPLITEFHFDGSL